MDNQKWGTPAPVGVEPVASVHRDTLAMLNSGQVKPWDDGARLYPASKARFDAEFVGVYTTPQPTQAQAGAVPLTDAQSHALIERMANEAEQWAEGLSYEPTQEQLSGWCVAFIQREIHFAHGIKQGGQ